MTSFAERFGREPETRWRAPGRVNLIGEHTDYNDGFVLPMAVQLGVQVDGARRHDGVLRIASAQEPGEPVTLGLDSLVVGALPGWAAYVAGTAWALRERGIAVPGADLLVDGDVPRGSGLSSSAALECATAGALLDLAGGGLAPLEVALACQHAENAFVGVPCGVMDQAAAMLCRPGHLLLLDCRSLVVEQIPFDLEAAGLTLLVTDTRAPHRLVDGEYADRRAACERAAALLGIASLRDLEEPHLPAALARLDDPVLARRVRHVVTENARVLRAVALLSTGRPGSVGPLLDASHASLRVDFEVSCPELDLAVDAARAAGALGARMTGGGFGGSTLALVPTSEAPRVVAAVSEAFAAEGLRAPVSRAMSPSAGAARALTGSGGESPGPPRSQGEGA